MKKLILFLATLTLVACTQESPEQKTNTVKNPIQTKKVIKTNFLEKEGYECSYKVRGKKGRSKVFYTSQLNLDNDEIKHKFYSIDKDGNKLTRNIHLDQFVISSASYQDGDDENYEVIAPVRNEQGELQKSYRAKIKFDAKINELIIKVVAINSKGKIRTRDKFKATAKASIKDCYETSYKMKRK